MGAGAWETSTDGRSIPGARRGAGLASRAAKRTLDITVALIVLILTLPVMVIVAIAIVAESPGPIFYRARRVGLGGRPLRMLKFRKMAPDAGGSALTLSNDPRLTRVGAVLTRTRLDELPQFWHVLRGEMSLVGPRPEDPRFVAERPDDFRRILTVRPGITGLSQLAYAEEPRILSRVDREAFYVKRILPQKCLLDRLYTDRVSVLMDMRILVWTLIAVVLRKPVAVSRTTGAASIRRRPAATAPDPVVAPAPATALLESTVSVAEEPQAVTAE